MMMRALNTLNMMHESFKLIRLLLMVGFVGGLLGCGEQVDSRYYEAQGTSQARINEVSKHIHLPAEQQSALLASVLDAQLFEEKIGVDGFMGPSDYCRFIALTIQPQALEDWRRLLTPKSLETWGQYPTPAQPKIWWVTEPVYKTLTLYDAYTLMHLNGSIGIEKSGKIYVHICTN